MIAILLVKASFGSGLGGGGPAVAQAVTETRAAKARALLKTDANRTAISRLGGPQILGQKSICAAAKFATHANHTLFEHRLVVLIAIASEDAAHSRL